VFEVGFTEIIMVALVALLVVGPERLPELVRNTGRWIGRFQRIAREMRTEFDRDVGREELTRLQHDLRSTTSERIVLPEPTAKSPVIEAPAESKGPGAV
jgi:sec-independent protein translocase protein TatB